MRHVIISSVAACRYSSNFLSRKQLSTRNLETVGDISARHVNGINVWQGRKGSTGTTNDKLRLIPIESYAPKFFDFTVVRKRMTEMTKDELASSGHTRINTKKFIQVLYFEAKRLMEIE